MRSVLAAIGIALLTTMLALHATPSSAQKRDDQKTKEEEQKAADRTKERKAVESQYKSAIERLPDQKYDPWRNMR
ncbi:MAG TPA: hypothetical protein VK438_11650 [Xanthobacteraceae bacterium]|nr:hypothetical protein [Xanthobacteraceae bacterium]